MRLLWKRGIVANRNGIFKSVLQTLTFFKRLSWQHWWRELYIVVRCVFLRNLALSTFWQLCLRFFSHLVEMKSPWVIPKCHVTATPLTPCQESPQRMWTQIPWKNWSNKYVFLQNFIPFTCFFFHENYVHTSFALSGSVNQKHNLRRHTCKMQR